MAIDPALLEPGERLLWSGRPNALRYMQARSGISTILGLATLVMSEFLMNAGRDGRILPWIGMIVFIVAIALLLAPLLLVWRARLTDYAVTDRRVLIVTRQPLGRLDVMPRSGIRSIELRQRSGGVADVLIERVAAREPVGILAIADADQVERLLRSSLQPDGRP
jgi:hypothetical protein